MTGEDGTRGGWSFVAENDGAAALLGCVLELDSEESYTKSEMASAAGVPMKRLYLSEALEGLIELGVLTPVEDAEEACYTIDADTPVYREAAAFDEAVAAALEE